MSLSDSQKSTIVQKILAYLRREISPTDYAEFIKSLKEPHKIIGHKNKNIQMYEISDEDLPI